MQKKFYCTPRFPVVKTKEKVLRGIIHISKNFKTI